MKNEERKMSPGPAVFEVELRRLSGMESKMRLPPVGQPVAPSPSPSPSPSLFLAEDRSVLRMPAPQPHEACTGGSREEGESVARGERKLPWANAVEGELWEVVPTVQYDATRRLEIALRDCLLCAPQKSCRDPPLDQSGIGSRPQAGRCSL